MSQPKANIALRQMLDYAREAASMVEGKTRPDLDKDRKLNLALVRLLEIIGEAATRIPKEEQVCYSDIHWAEIISLRNRLIHGYDMVDFDILWQIITQDLPDLIKALQKALSGPSPG